MAFEGLASAFEAGKQAAPMSPFGYAAGNVMDLFKMQQENAFKLAQTAALFRGEKEYEYQTDPTKVEAAQRQKSNADFLGGGNSLGPGAGGAQPGAEASPGASGSPPTKIGNPFKSPNQSFGGTIQDTADIYGRHFTSLDAIGQKKQAEMRAEQATLVDPLIGTSVGVLKGGVGRFKQMAAENPFGAGRAAGLYNQYVGGPTGTSPSVSAYHGLRVEIATELAKIANPSGRGAQATVDEFMKLLPDDYSNWDEAANKIHDAAQNAFARYHAYKYGSMDGYSPDLYASQVQDILDAPASGQSSMNPLQKAGNANKKEDDRTEIKKRIATGRYEKTKSKMVGDFKKEYGEDL